MPIRSDPQGIVSQRVLRFDAYWRARCGRGVAPFRSSIDPADFRPLLAHVVIADFDPDRLAVRYRLVGTQVAAMSRMDFTGRTLDELAFQVNQPEIWRDSYRRIAETGGAVYGRVEIPADAGAGCLVQEEFAIFPLTHDGRRISQCIAIEDYQPTSGPRSTLDITRLRPMRMRDSDEVPQPAPA